jgi:hypothetical protein
MLGCCVTTATQRTAHLRSDPSGSRPLIANVEAAGVPGRCATGDFPADIPEACD